MNPAFNYGITGFVNGDFLNQSLLSNQPNYATTADPESPAGLYPITISQGNLAYADPDYTFSSVSS